MNEVEFLRRMPKAELHCHLEGAVPAAVFVELAREKGIPLDTYEPDSVYEIGDSLETFLVVYGKVCASMASADDFSRVAYATLHEAATKGNLRYREMFFNPTNHPGLPYKEQLAGLRDGIAAAQTDLGVVCRLIPSINREQSQQVAREMVEDVIAHPCAEVIGIGLDHNELAAPPAAFVEAFALAKQAGLHRSAHAGERASSAEIAESLDLLDCDRIDHGYALVNDPDLLASVRDRRIPVTACWTVSTFHHGDDPETTPVGRMIKEGLWISVNSDDPPMVGTDIGEEFVRVARTLSLARGEMVELCLAAVDAAWVSDDERRAMRDRFTNEIAELEQQLELVP